MKPVEKFYPISGEALESFKENSPEIIKNTVNRSLKREEEVNQHGKQARQILISGMEFTTKMLEAAMLTGEISLLEDVLIWAQDRLPHDQVTMDQVKVRLIIYREELIKIMPKKYSSKITPYIDYMISWRDIK